MQCKNKFQVQKNFLQKIERSKSGNWEVEYQGGGVGDKVTKNRKFLSGERKTSLHSRKEQCATDWNIDVNVHVVSVY